MMIMTAKIAMNNELTLVPHFFRNLFGYMLNLKKKLDSLDGSHGRLRDSGRDTTGDEIFGEGSGIC